MKWILALCFGIGLIFEAGAAFSSGPQAPPESGAPKQMAGWAEVEITPPLGITMGGRGPTAVAGKSVLDPLVAQVLCLKDVKGTMMVLVSADLIGFSHELSDRLRLDIVHETGAPWDLVVLNASHTHSGPLMNHTLFAGAGPLPKNQSDYFDALEERIVGATRRALKSMAPAGVEVFEGTSQVAINRRGRNKAGVVSILPNPAGPIADKLWVMKVTPRNGKAPALVFSYGCHPVIVYGYAGAAISADFPGFARKVLRERLGEKGHVQFVQGLAGDVRPRAVADVANNRFKSGGGASLQAAGNQMAQDVLATLKLKGKNLELDMAGTGERPVLRRGTPPPRSFFETALKNATEPAKAAMARYWLERYDRGEGFATGDPWPAGLIRLAADQWVFWLAGEPCVEWAPLAARWLAPRPVVIWGYCQESLSYLPTDALLPEGGYEVLDSNRNRASSPAPFAPGLDEAIRQSLVRQVRFLE